jgi:Jumping translocation breakpoint protein (JTB)
MDSMTSRRTHRTRRRRSTLCLTLLTLSVCLPPHARAMKRETDSRQTAYTYERTRRRLDDQEEEAIECEATGVCEMCTDAERSIPESECEPTGRHQHFKCVTSIGDEQDTSIATYRSCKRTEADEEFLMMRLQAICFTIGVVSLFSVRRNRQLGAFDQRKEGKRGNILNLAALSDNEQEMVPLAPSDPLDVV